MTAPVYPDYLVRSRETIKVLLYKITALQRESRGWEWAVSQDVCTDKTHTPEGKKCSLALKIFTWSLLQEEEETVLQGMIKI